MEFLIIFIVILILAVLFVISQVHDFKIKSVKSSELFSTSDKVLIIYPHPDDEVFSTGGLIQDLVRRKVDVTVVSITPGEYGDAKLRLPPAELGKIRRHEFSEVMNILGVVKSEVWDFIDGQVSNNVEKLTNDLKKFILRNGFTIVVTYEKMGVYGHPDHIALSQVVHLLSKELKLKALYSTLNKKILKRINLPKTLTYNDRVVELNVKSITSPKYKINVLRYVGRKYKAVKKYKSQGLVVSIPRMMAGMFEYFTDEYN